MLCDGVLHGVSIFTTQKNENPRAEIRVDDQHALPPLFFKPEFSEGFPPVKVTGAFNAEIRNYMLHVFRRHGRKNINDKNDGKNSCNKDKLTGKNEDDLKEKHDGADIGEIFLVPSFENPRRGRPGKINFFLRGSIGIHVFSIYYPGIFSQTPAWHRTLSSARFYCQLS